MTAVSVTAEHIAKGGRRSCERCPVALAILDAFPHLIYVRVGPDNIGVLRSEGEYLTLLAWPPGVLDFIRDFDKGAVTAPFTFELDYPAVAS